MALHIIVHYLVFFYINHKQNFKFRYLHTFWLQKGKCNHQEIHTDSINTVIYGTLLCDCYFLFLQWWNLHRFCDIYTNYKNLMKQVKLFGHGNLQWFNIDSSIWQILKVCCIICKVRTTSWANSVKHPFSSVAIQSVTIINSLTEGMDRIH